MINTEKSSLDRDGLVNQKPPLSTSEGRATPQSVNSEGKRTNAGQSFFKYYRTERNRLVFETAKGKEAWPGLDSRRRLLEREFNKLAVSLSDEQGFKEWLWARDPREI